MFGRYRFFALVDHKSMSHMAYYNHSNRNIYTCLINGFPLETKIVYILSSIRLSCHIHISSAILTKFSQHVYANEKCYNM